MTADKMNLLRRFQRFSVQMMSRCRKDIPEEIIYAGAGAE
jgi:hypothetical protein